MAKCEANVASTSIAVLPLVQGMSPESMPVVAAENDKDYETMLCRLRQQLAEEHGETIYDCHFVANCRFSHFLLLVLTTVEEKLLDK